MPSSHSASQTVRTTTKTDRNQNRKQQPKKTTMTAIQAKLHPHTHFTFHTQQRPVCFRLQRFLLSEQQSDRICCYLQRLCGSDTTTLARVCRGPSALHCSIGRSIRSCGWQSIAETLRTTVQKDNNSGECDSFFFRLLTNDCCKVVKGHVCDY